MFETPKSFLSSLFQTKRKCPHMRFNGGPTFPQRNMFFLEIKKWAGTSAEFCFPKFVFNHQMFVFV